MALSRTSSTVRLKSDDGLYYTVALVDLGDDIIIPEADDTTGAVGTSDFYVALNGSDGQIYRWSLETIFPNNVQHLIELSPDQSESSVDGLDLLFGSQWLRVKVELQPIGSGLSIPNLIVVDGAPWPPAPASIGRGGLSTFVRPNRTFATYRY